MKYFKIILFLTLSFHRVINAEPDLSILNIIKSFQNKSYDKNIRPNHGGDPVMINVSIHINDISSVSEVNMDITTDIFLRQFWHDERLKFNSTNGLDMITVGNDIIKNLWLPDTYFIGGKNVIMHTSTNYENNAFLRIDQNGDTTFSIRATIVTICKMNLKYFPLDQQYCEINISSYGYSMDNLDYEWLDFMDNGNGLKNDFSLPNFRVEGYKLQKHIVKLNLNYSVLILGILLTRSIGYYINQVYLPAAMIVVLSWIPFWLDMDDAHARVGLGVTTVLTLTTLITNTNASLPKISYMKSIDIYLGFCFTIVFAALLEYATVGHYKYNNDNKVSVTNDNERKAKIKKGFKRSSLIDIHSRWVFPIVFIIFNLGYWFLYFKLSTQTYTGVTLFNH